MATRRGRRAVAAVWLSAAMIGCAGSAKEPAAPEAPSKPEVQALERITIVGHTTEELLGDIEKARGLLLVEKHREAAEGFDRVMRLAGEDGTKAIAAYEAGVAYEGLGEREMAIERYRMVGFELSEQPVARNALVRLSRLLGRLERWGELEEAADALLRRDDLPAMDRIEAHGAKALALVERGTVDEAAVHVGKATAIIDQHGFGRSGAPPVQLAQVSFAEGEIRRLRSEAITLVPSPNFGQILEARCQGLLDAQAAYTEAMRARDAHWSAMSGFRVGQLYHQLHREAMAIPPPANATTLEKKQLFEAAMRLRYRVLLEKGLKMMEATVRLGDRTGEDSEWIARARESKRTLEQALADEKAALAKMPFTESEMQAALDILRGKKKP